VRVVDRAIAATLPAVPRPVVRHFASRYIAGESLADALRVVRTLNERGICATIDVLGESVRRVDQAQRTAREYEDVMNSLADHGLEAGISVKLSAIGIEVDHELAVRQLESVIRCAARHDRFVRIDMEESRLVDSTLAVYRRMRAAGHENVGVVIQSYLRRALADIRDLAPLAPSVRLVKGIYIEPRRIAYRDMVIVNRNFTLLLEELLAGEGHVGIATHDERLVWEALRLIDKLGVPGDRYEFQMLLGVDPELRDLLVDAGHRMRIYVPFGEAWYAYSIRRLQENPSIAGYVAVDAARALLGR
jgi:proline dehydrogenase